MKKKIIKLLSMCLIITIVLTSSFSFAASTADADGLRDSAGGEGEAAAEIQESGVRMLQAVMWLGYAIALGILVFIGIKYMTGAADAKANRKSAITSWVIGAFVVVMAATIAGWVAKIIDVDTNADSHGLADNIVNALNSETN